METLDFINFASDVKQGPVVTAGWRKSKERYLILLEKADKLDTKHLMSPDEGRGRDTKVNVTANSLRAIIDYIKSDNRQTEANHAFGIAIFSSSNWQETISELKPTKILLCGFRSSSLMLPDLTNLRYMLGNPVVRDGVTYCQTLPVDQLLFKDDNSDKDASMSDLLFMVARHASNLLKGHNPESLAGIKAKPIIVDTMDKFHRLLQMQWDAQEFAVDLETNNLSSYKNKILTYQVAFDTDKGYILPIEHANSPFTREEQKEIKRELRRLWATSRKDQRKLVVLFNGKFDLRVLRASLKLPAIHHDVYEVTAGEHLLDENIGLLTNSSFRGLESTPIKVRMGNLRNMFCMYGNDSYYTMPFSKEQRDTISAVNIMEHKEAQRYCALDPCATFGLYKSQCAYAKRLKVRNKHDKLVSYYPFFIRHSVHQMGVTAKTLSLMEEYGTYVDMEYCVALQDPKVSKLIPLIRSLKRRLLALDSVKQTEKILNKKEGKTSNTLFAVSADVSTFQIKPKHLEILFFDVLKVKPLKFTAKGTPSVDKDFLAEYRDSHEEAEILADYSEARKLLSTYVGSWQSAIVNDKDGQLDGCLRPSFGFFDVVTGRLSSRDPNLQNVPNRGKLAKLIKRMFISPRGTLSPRWDFNAHEIRMWGNLAFDKAIAESFLVGFRLRQLLIHLPTDELRARLKKEGDAHIANVFRFFGKWVEKSDPMRDAVKAVVFGVVYGKSARTLGIDLQKSRIAELKRKLKSIPAGEDTQQVLDDLEAAQDLDPFIEQAETILTKMEKDMPKGMKWLATMKSQVEQDFEVMSPIGRPRKLWRTATKINKSLGDAGRRAKNSPVQGIASEIGVTSGYLSYMNTYVYSKRPNVKAALENSEFGSKALSRITRLVHDASYYNTPYELLIPQIQIGLWSSTSGCAEYYTEHFDFTMLAPPEVELELCAREDKTYKWDYTLPEFGRIVRKSLEDQKELGHCDDVDEAMRKIFWCWLNKEERMYLFENYPILDVPYDQIKSQLLLMLKEQKLIGAKQ